MKGKLTVFTGPVHSEKTENLILFTRKLEKRGFKVAKIKQMFDMEDKVNKRGLIVSHSGLSMEAEVVYDEYEIISKLSGCTAIVIDEVQFFSDVIIELITDALSKGYEIAVAGINKDFRGKPFGPMPEIMAMADELHMFSAVCAVCGKDASMTQRFTDGQPSKFDERVLEKGKRYEARCRDCFEI